MNRGISKKVIAGFVAMGVVIIGLIIALVVTNRGKNDDSWKTSSPKKKSETVSSEAEESEAEEEEEEDSEEEEEEEDSESEEEESEAEKEDDVKKEGYVVSWSSGNSWEDSGKQMSGLDIGIANYSDDAVSGWTVAPSHPRRTSPCFIRSSIICFAILIGMAKPMPCA